MVNNNSNRKVLSSFKFNALISAMLLALGVSGGVSAQIASPPVTEVEVVNINPQNVEIYTELPGRVAANQFSEVRPQVGGLLRSRLFEEGAYVEKGQLLYEIEDSSYKAAYNSAKAALNKAESNIKSLTTTVNRYKELARIKAASQQDYENYKAQLDMAYAERESAKAAVEMAQIDLDNTKIVAPISGVIGASTLTEGTLLSSNQMEPLATILQIDTVFVDILQSSAQLLRTKNAIASGKLKPSERTSVTLTLEDGSTYPIEGSLKFSDAKVDPSTGSITLRAEFPNPDQLLLPGMYVRASMSEGVMEDALLVPQRALTRDKNGDGVVMILSASGEVEQRTLKTARTLIDKWIIDSGLEDNVQVITSGLQKVQPGAKAKAAISSSSEGKGNAESN